MLLAGNMYYYAALYLLPVLVLEMSSANQTIKQSKQSNNAVLCAFLWLALLCPVQLVLLGRSANQVIGNVALMGLMATRLVFGWNCLAAKNAKVAKI